MIVNWPVWIAFGFGMLIGGFVGIVVIGLLFEVRDLGSPCSGPEASNGK